MLTGANHGPVIREELENEAETDPIEAALSETCLASLLAGMRARDLRIMAMNALLLLAIGERAC
jgi:hypothetical protein